MSCKEPVIGIKSIGFYVPERTVSNEDLAKWLDTSNDWIVSHTGINQRHVAATEQAASDLGIQAALQVLDLAQLQSQDIDLIIVSSSTPDYYGFPSTACLIQHQLGCVGAAAFDIAAACSGFVYGLQIAKGMMLAEPDYRNILVVAAEKLSSVTNWEDRSTAVLLGDGAGAVIMNRQQAENDLNHELLDSVLLADGARAGALLIPHGGSCCPVIAGQAEIRNKLEMDGRAVYNFAVAAVQKIIHMLLERNSLAIDEIAYIVLHQANKRIIQAVAKRENISMERFYCNIASYANTSSASIPIALCEMQEKNVLNKGDLILTIGFGSGLTYGGNLIRW